MMYKTFGEYQQRRELQNFEVKFDALCEGILWSGIAFNEFWRGVAIPVLMTGTCSNEEELLETFGRELLRATGAINEVGLALWEDGPFNFGPSSPHHPANRQPAQPGWGSRLFGGVKKLFGGGNAAPVSPVGPGDAGGIGGNPPSDAGPELNDPFAKIRGQFEGPVAEIKKQFGMAMNGFLKGVKDYAAKMQNPHILGVGQLLNQKIMQVAQPVIDQFSHSTLPFKKKGDTASGYRKEFDAMMQGQQNNRTNALKDRAQDPNNRGKISAMRGNRGGWTDNELKQWATEEAQKNGNQLDYYLTPQGKPTPRAMAVLPDAAEWRSQQSGGQTTFGGAQAPPAKPAGKPRLPSSPGMESMVR
jgi:hypothetical protein